MVARGRGSGAGVAGVRWMVSGVGGVRSGDSMLGVGTAVSNHASSAAGAVMREAPGCSGYSVKGELTTRGHRRATERNCGNHFTMYVCI